MSADEERRAGSLTRTSSPSAVSCRGLLVRAAVFSALFFFGHVLGFREYTRALLAAAASSSWQRFWGTVYFVLYLCFVGIVPVLLIASGLLKGFALLQRRRTLGRK